MWDERYSEPGFAYGIEPNDFLASVADRLPRGRVLCLGEGEGRNAVYLAGLGFEVTAVDASAVGLAKAQRHAAERALHVETHVADLADFDMGIAAWQGIVSIFCHLSPALRADVHARCAQALAPGGAFVLEAFTPKQLEYRTGGPRAVEMMMRLDELKRELSGLRFEIGRELEREVYEGKYHRGMSAVVQLLGFKVP